MYALLPLRPIRRLDHLALPIRLLVGLFPASLIFFAISALAGCSANGSGSTTAGASAPIPPSIVSQPKDQTVSCGGTATFAVLADGNPSLSYQWQRNGSNIPGATSSSYVLQAVTAADNNSAFDVIVTNSAGKVTSDTVMLAVAGCGQTINFTALANVTYGVAPLTLTAAASSGLPVNYTVTGPASVSGSALTITAAGTVMVTANQAGNAAYAAATPVTQGFTVGKAALTVIANNTSMPYGGTVPSLGYTITGFVNGDTQATATTGAPALSTTATSTSSAGGYSITIVQGTLAATNYTFMFVNGTFTVTGGTAFPLRASTNGRYFVDQNNVPFLLLGDSPQSMIVNLSTADMAAYMSNRQAHGFNAILVDVLVDAATGGYPNGTTFDGIAPFSSGASPADYDLSTPNPAYFSRLDTLVSMANSHGLLVMLDPIETGGWLPTLENNGATQAFNYGAFLGNRYKNSPNVFWQSGNDFQDWNSNATDNSLVYQVMAGIASMAPNQIQTIELNFQASYSNQDQATLGSTLTLDAAYTYFETYDEVLHAYHSSPVIPVFLTEANYEYENDTGYFSGLTGTFILREQEYWTMTNGATGQLYGNRYTWSFISGWQNYLDSPGTVELAYLNKLFSSIPWWKLVPEENHQIVTAGYGTYHANNGDLPLADYATTAWLPDGSLAIVYDPAGSALTVNLASFSQPVTAEWYDPSNGTYSTIAGSPFPNSGTYTFTPDGVNNDSDTDWVLILTINPISP